MELWRSSLMFRSFVYRYTRTQPKKFGCTTVQGATSNMRGQLYRGHANATVFSSSPVVSALGSESDDPGSPG